MTPQAREIINMVATKRGIHPLLITSHCRKRHVMFARAEVAKLLRARNYSMPRIGQLLNHDHTTIVFYLGFAKKKLPPETPPVWRKPIIRHLRRCKPYVEPPPRDLPKPKCKLPFPYAGAQARGERL